MKINRADTLKGKDPVLGSDGYSEALKYIRKAIDCLGEVSKDDKIAKDAIANLSVVLLDLTK